VGNIKYDGLYPFNVKHGAQGGYDISLLCDDISHYQRLGYKVYVSVLKKEAKEGLAQMLSERGIKAYTGEDFEPKGGEAVIVSGKLETGYESDFTKTVLLCDVKTQRERLEKKKDAVQKMKRREISSKYKNSTQKIISYADLNVGDYVVHASYGIGIFCGIESISDKNVTKDYIKIKYAGTDVLFVPVGSLDMVSKYIGAGSDDSKLKLSKLSTNDWSKAKSHVKKEVKQMAEKLVKLYAERRKPRALRFLPTRSGRRSLKRALNMRRPTVSFLQ
jgi:transcription-repair coupling factor (superfamily II helicase)